MNNEEQKNKTMVSTINMIQHAFGKTSIKSARDISNTQIKNTSNNTLLIPKQQKQNDLTYSSFYWSGDSTQEKSKGKTVYQNTGCRINTDGAGNIHLVESNPDQTTTNDINMPIVRPFLDTVQAAQSLSKQYTCNSRRKLMPYENGQVTSRTTRVQSTGHCSQKTLTYNQSGIQLQCYDYPQFQNAGNKLFQITGRKMLNRDDNKLGESTVSLKKKQIRSNKASSYTIQSIVRKEDKMRKFQRNYMISQKKQEQNFIPVNHQVTPELCDRSISAKNSLEAGTSIESQGYNVKNVIKAPFVIKQPKDIIIRITKDEKGNFCDQTSNHDTIFVNNEDDN